MHDTKVQLGRCLIFSIFHVKKQQSQKVIRLKTIFFCPPARRGKKRGETQEEHTLSQHILYKELTTVYVNYTSETPKFKKKQLTPKTQFKSRNFKTNTA